MHLLLRLVVFCLVFLMPVCAYSQDEVSARYDAHMAQLAVLSQQDPRFESVPYNNVTLQMAGCGPVSLCNVMVSAFSVTDSDEAVAIMKEMLPLIVKDGQYRKRPIHSTLLPNVLNINRLSPEKRPLLRQLVESYPGTIAASANSLKADDLAGYLDTGDPLLLCGRISVSENWNEIVSILSLLYNRGFHDATLCMGYVGAGTSSTGSPFRSGKSGHYVSILFHTGVFFESGAFYLLDSLPRYLPGETGGEGTPFRVGFSFPKDGQKSAFNRLYTVSRISPTVLKVQPDASEFESAAEIGDESERISQLAQLLDPVKLHGRAMAILRTDVQNILQTDP